MSDKEPDLEIVLKDLRNRIHRLRNGLDEFDQELKEIIQIWNHAKKLTRSFEEETQKSEQK